MEQDFSGIFSRTMRVSAVGAATVTRRVDANENERAALAALFKLPGISALSGEFELTHERGGVIAARLRLAARICQVCVVSLEEFWAELREETALRFMPAATVKESVEVEMDPETLEGPDEIYYGGETIDLGGVLAEQLALSLDPYPRKPGTKLATTNEPTDQNPNPFAALGRWGKRAGEGDVGG